MLHLSRRLGSLRIAHRAAATVARTAHAPTHTTNTNTYTNTYNPHTPCQTCLRSIHSLSRPLLSDSSSPSSSSSSSPFTHAADSSSQLYTSFGELGLNGPLVERLKALGVATPTAIQERVLPALQAWTRTPVLVQSPTGTGKSLAFLLPVLNRLMADDEARIRARQPRTHVQAVLLVPSQELAFQTRAQVESLLASREGDQPEEGFVGMALGGEETVESQQAALLAAPPALLIATPKRLNQILFPQYNTHNKTQTDVIFDPIEDDQDVESLDYSQVQSRGESHRAPTYESAVNLAASLTDPAYAARNNIATVSGGVYSDRDDAAPPAVESSDDAHRRMLLREDQDELDGIKSEYLPSRKSLSYEAQRFLITPQRLARERLRSRVGHKVFTDLKYIVLDEIDQVLKPQAKHPSDKQKIQRMRHPKPGQILLKGLQLLNPRVQLVGASATISGQLTRLLWNLGFNRPGQKPLRITVEPRANIAAHTDKAATERRTLELRGESAPLQLSGDSTAAGASNVNSIVHAAPSALEDRRSSHVATFYECPPNISHFFTVAPSSQAWADGTHWLPAPDADRLAEEAGAGDEGGRMKYDYFASAEERQSIHEHNMHVRWSQRRTAWVLDKLCAARVLVHQLRPKCTIMVIDEEQHKLKDVAYMAAQVGLKTTNIFEHLSSPSASVRAQFFRDVADRKYDLYLVGLESVRGLDIPQCDLVMNLHMLKNPQEYLHSAGRTGRFGKVGSVLTLLHPEELYVWDNLKRSMPQTLATSKQLTLPKRIDRSLLACFDDAYASNAVARQRHLDGLHKEMVRKLKRKVAPDSKKSREEKEYLKQIKRDRTQIEPTHVTRHNQPTDEDSHQADEVVDEVAEKEKHDGEEYNNRGSNGPSRW